MATTRREIHLRRIEMRGYELPDGRVEIDGRVVDTKPHDFTPPTGERTVPAGQPIHDLGVRMVIDRDMKVVDIETSSDSTPYATCVEGGRALQTMVGARVGPGWSTEVKRRLAGAASCTHLMELLLPMATAAYQALSVVRLAQPDVLDAAGRPVKIDSCYGFRADGPIVAIRWPAHARTAQGDGSASG
jgi:hypothetical protein